MIWTHKMYEQGKDYPKKYENGSHKRGGRKEDPKGL